jgi:hypothetical protein
MRRASRFVVALAVRSLCFAAWTTIAATIAAADDLPCVDAPADGTPVRVVDAASGMPVAGAFVTWFEIGAEKDESDDAPCEPRLEQLRRKCGKTVRTDADGATRVGEFTWIVASADDRYSGFWHWERGRTLELKLKPRRSITVVTVDRDGKPVADVPIALRTREKCQSSLNEWRVRTGADGRVVIGPLDLYATFNTEGLRELYVAVDAPLSAPLLQRFTLAEIPAQPVRFAMPPTGRMVIDVVDADGQPCQELWSKHVRARWAFAQEESDDVAGARWPVVEWFVHDRRSHHELPHVETGLRIVVHASGAQDLGVKSIVDGPKSPGETVTVRLVRKVADQMTGRILDEKGEPLAGREVSLFVMNDKRRLQPKRIGAGTTDGDGRLRASISGFVARGYAYEAEWWLAPVVLRPDGNGVLASALLEFPKAKRIAATDLGDVRLHAAHLFASGIAVDDLGAPVPGAALFVMVSPNDFHSGSYLSTYDPLLRGTAAQDGTFAIYGDAPDGKLDLSASEGGPDGPVHLERSDPLEFTAGATALRLVLWRAGYVVSRVVGDEAEFRGIHLSVSWRRPDGVQSEFTSNVRDDGTIEFDAPIGVVDFKVFQDGATIATRRKIEIKPGAVTEVAPIVLASTETQIELTIVDERGKPIPAGWVAMPDKDDGVLHRILHPRRPHVTVFDAGQITVRSDESLPAFAVGAAGRTAVVVYPSAPSQRVVLEPAPKVALVLEYDGDPLPAPLLFFVSLAATSDDDEWFRFGPGITSRARSLELPQLDGIPLERGKPVELPVRCLGATRLELMLGKVVPDGRSGTAIECDPAQIDIRRTPDQQTFHIKVARAAIDAVLKQKPDK